MVPRAFCSLAMKKSVRGGIVDVHRDDRRLWNGKSVVDQECPGLHRGAIRH